MAGNSQLIQLKKDIKEKKLHNIYLFYGEEAYLKEYYINQVTELIPDGGYPEFNRISFKLHNFSTEDISDAVESFPFMSDKKLIYFSGSGIFSSKGEKINDTEKQFWVNVFKSLTDDTILIFNETDIDKRGSVYKAAAKKGFVIEFSYMKESDLVNWVLKQSLDNKYKIDKRDIEYLVSLCDDGLSNLKNELDKLFSYCDDKIISRHDIDRIVSKPLQFRIFDLTDGILDGNTSAVVSVLNELNTQNEPAFGTLYLLFSTFNRILKAKVLAENHTPYAEIVQRLGVHKFIAQKSIEYAQRISEKTLVKIVSAVSELDLAIKEGRLSDRAALEKYVFDAVALING